VRTGRAVLDPDVDEAPDGREGVVGTPLSGAGDVSEPPLCGPGVMFPVALAQLFLYPSSVFSDVGLMAKTMPD